MGLTTLPKVGTGEALGPVKQDRPLAGVADLRYEITAAEHGPAMAAIEAVCAEVGLHDGSTAGSLVARVKTIEDSGGGGGGPHASTHASGGSDPVSPASIGAMAVGAAPTAHAASHASGGSDAVTPALIGAARRTVATAVFTGATIALYDGFDQCIARISSASNAVSIEIEDTLEGGGSSDSYAFSCTLVVSAYTNPITFATGAGLLTPVFMGTLKTITKVGTMIAIQVSNGVARVAIIEVAP